MRFYYWIMIALCAANLAATAVCVHSAYKCWRIAEESADRLKAIESRHRFVGNGYAPSLDNAWAAPRD